MTWIAVIIFLLVLLAGVGGAFLLFGGGSDKAEVKKRISLLELRTLQKEDLPEVLKEEVLSEVPLLNRLLSGIRTAVRIDRRLRQADMKMRVGTFVLLSLALFAAGLIAGKILHWPTVFALIVGLGLMAVPNIVVDVKRRLRLKRFMNYF